MFLKNRIFLFRTMTNIIERFRELAKDYGIEKEHKISNAIYFQSADGKYKEIIKGETTYIILQATASNDLGLLLLYMATIDKGDRDLIRYGVSALPLISLENLNGEFNHVVLSSLENKSKIFETQRDRSVRAESLYIKIRDDSVKTNRPFDELLIL